MSTINLTQHPATLDQVAAGVFDLSKVARAELQTLLTFASLPDRAEIEFRANRIADLAAQYAIADDRADDGNLTARDSGGFAIHAMIGGALWLMAPLAAALRAQGFEPVFAFSVRETEEQPQPDGSVRKIAVFRHCGWVPALLDPSEEPTIMSKVTEKRANLAAAPNLAALLVAMLATNDLTDEESDRIDWSDLPTFGGEEPSDTVGIWSWDPDNMIVGTCEDDIEIVSRIDYYAD